MDTRASTPRAAARAWRLLIGAPRDVGDPRIFHRLSLVTFLAWVGLGADGLSSSAYGPEEAYRALGGHTHLAFLLFGMMAATIAMISIAYSNLIQHFPGGGGGYLVATKLLGSEVGVVSGCALLVDYVLTITVSVASACDQIWSFLPPQWAPWKLTCEFGALGALVVLNLRGVRESVTVLAPVFLLFLVTHAVAIAWAIAGRASALPGVVQDTAVDFHGAVATLGWGGVALVLLRAYSLGGGTYTGIEAVSNGVTMFREPRVQTARRTMALMAISLALTAGGILLGYLLTGAEPVPGKTMNAVLLSNVFGGWNLEGIPLGTGLVVLSLAAEGALLLVAAQTGFLDGPRVLSNMALDSWMPHRLAQLSDRLVTQNGVVLMGTAAAGALLYTGGNITTLVVMYSINVFITFSLTELGMARHWIVTRAREPKWRRQLAIHATGLVMCATILVVTVSEKFLEGGWMTLVITGAVIAGCYRVRFHYRKTQRELAKFESLVGAAPARRAEAPADHASLLDRDAPTAVLCVSSFSGFGLHQLLAIQRSFPRYFRNVLFVSVGVIDSGVFKGADAIDRLRQDTEDHLRRYVAWARAHGLPADYRMTVGTEVITGVHELCRDVVREYPRAIVFMGRLVFRRPRWYHKLLHNETAIAIERRLFLDNLQSIVLPIRVQEA